MFYANQSAFTLNNVVNDMSSSTNQLEGQMNGMLEQIQNNPNPSQGQLLQFQAVLQIWTSLINMESSIIKVYGDTMKQVVSNMGS